MEKSEKIWLDGKLVPWHTLEVGKWADITVMDIDPLVVGDTEPGKLFDGNIVTTIVGGKVLYQAE